MRVPKGAPHIDICIPEEKREEIAQGLSRLLADSYTLYLMTHNFHWNVTGPMFNTLHAISGLWCSSATIEAVTQIRLNSPMRLSSGLNGEVTAYIAHEYMDLEA